MSHLFEFGRRIKELRIKNNLTQEELAKKTGYTSRSSINKIELGQVDVPQTKIMLIADALNVSPTYLIFGKNTVSFPHSDLRPVSKKKIPLLGNVACGEPIFAQEEYENYIEANADCNVDFCLIAKGDSMINARIFDGDVLFVKKQNMVDDGEIAVVLIDDEATVKRVYHDKENNILTLIPENPLYKPMRFFGEELDHIRILGKIIFGQYTT